MSLNLWLKWLLTRMGLAPNLVSLVLLCVNVSCLPGPDPLTYHFSKTVWTTKKGATTPDVKIGEILILKVWEASKKSSASTPNLSSIWIYIYQNLLLILRFIRLTFPLNIFQVRNLLAITSYWLVEEATTRVMFFWMENQSGKYVFFSLDIFKI